MVQQQQQRITTMVKLPCIHLLSILLFGGYDGRSSATATAFVMVPGTSSHHRSTTTRPTVVPTLWATTDSNGPNSNNNNYEDANNCTSTTTTTTTTTVTATTSANKSPGPAIVLNGKRVWPIKILMGGIKGPQEQSVAATYAIFSSDYPTQDWKACQHIGITRNLQDTLQRHMDEQQEINHNNNNKSDTAASGTKAVSFVRALSFIIPNDGAMESIASDWRRLAIDAGGKTNFDPILAAMDSDINDDDNDDDDDEDDYFEMMADAMSASRSDLASARGIVESATTKPNQNEPVSVVPSSPFDQPAVYRSTVDDRPSLDFTRENVDKVLEEIRPYLISDGGNVSVERVDETTRNVYLKLQGACGSCPSSTVTMQMGIERVLKENFVNLGQVLQVDDVDPTKPQELTYQVVEQEVNRIRPAIIAMGGQVDIVRVDPMDGIVEIKFRGASKVKKGLELALLDIDFVKQVQFVMEEG